MVGSNIKEVLSRMIIDSNGNSITSFELVSIEQK